MSESSIPHGAGLLLVLYRVRAGRVAVPGAGAFTDNGGAFPNLLVPFLNELFDHGQAMVDESNGVSVVTTAAGEVLFSELEASDERNSVIAALSLLDPSDWGITSAPGQVMVSRTWPDGSSDSLLFLAGTAIAFRSDSEGRLVWRAGGSALGMTSALVDLPRPGTPGALSTPLPDHHGDLI